MRGNRRHYHPAWNEWWYIVAGTWKWEIEGQEMFVKEGDVVFIPKLKIHKITAVGDRPAVRLRSAGRECPMSIRSPKRLTYSDLAGSVGTLEGTRRGLFGPGIRTAPIE